MDEPISHPPEGGDDATKLRDHLEDVANRSRIIIPPGATSIGGDSLQEMTATVAKCHDFGKATTWFQEYIKPTGSPDGPTSHSLFGAYLSYYVLEELEYESEDCLAAFVALARHHNRLPDVGEYVQSASYFDRRKPANNTRQLQLIEQVKNVDDHRQEFARSFITDITAGAGSWDEFVSVITDRKLFDTVYEHVDTHSFGTDRAEPSHEFYDLLLQLWSGLVLADKTSAAGISIDNLEGSKPSSQTLREYIDGLGKSTYEDSRAEDLDAARTEAQAAALDGVERFLEADASVATLTLPTGMGKTLTGLSAAFELRDALDSERVVYALPFTSIIDQVANEVQQVFETDARDDLLTIHHHLAETATELEEDTDGETDAEARLEEMVAESWRSGMTVTTFVQLFESLAGPANTQSMKLPSLYDSVIVLDEPQALPMDWWKLVRRLVDILTEKYNATVIAMTATQPELFEDQIELIEDTETYFDRFERVQYEVHESALAFDNTEKAVQYEAAAKRLLDDCNGSESALAVCNTIDSAIALTRCVEEHADVVNVGQHLEEALHRPTNSIESLVESIIADLGPEERVLVHLSTRLRPRDRLLLIKAIKRLRERDVPVLAVSTQLIEAGVDISFDAVYRDIAPIDSIVQAAGRCNRSFENDRGRVTIWWLAPPEGTSITPAQAVYETDGVSAISITAETLDAIGARNGSLEEREMTRDAVQEYYREVANRNPGDVKYVSMVDEAKAKTLGKLSLIGRRNAVDVIVCRTEPERALVENLREAWGEFRYDEFDGLLQETREITVSVPIYDQNSPEADAIRTLPQLAETEIRILDTNRYGSYFDVTIGLTLEKLSVDNRFL